MENTKETKPTNDTQKLNLKSKVQEIRDAAKLKIQLGMVNRRMVTISNSVRAITGYKKNIVDMKKEEEVLDYNVSKLDKDHPNYEEDKKRADIRLKENKKELKDNIEKAEKNIKREEETIEKANEEIVKIEKGETLISLDRLNQESTETIEKL